MTEDSDFCRGLRVLLVEDESIIAMLTESMLLEMGCDDVVLAGTVGQALREIDQRMPDLAVLDVNLRGEMVLPVAERLARENVPFAFATGYNAMGVLAAWRDYPLVQKPFGMTELEAALKEALGVAG